MISCFPIVGVVSIFCLELEADIELEASSCCSCCVLRVCLCGWRGPVCVL